jgi:hypothetical protein
VKSQWENYLRRENRHHRVDDLPLDPAFAATYGPILATLRARFLRDAHPAWGVIGNWLRPLIECHQTSSGVIVPLLLAGVFFSDYDPVPYLAKKWMGALFDVDKRSGMTPIKSLYLEAHFDSIKTSYNRRMADEDEEFFRANEFLTLIPNKRREQQVLADVSFAIPFMCGAALRILQGLGGCF